MAKRRSWDSLSPAYRERLSRGGISKSGYESGANLSKARGHAKTPEHPSEAAKRPERYKEYIEKRQKPSGGGPPSPEDEAYKINAELDAAYYNFHGQLKDYIKYNRKTVLANVYGGTTSESGEVPGMDRAQARWTAQADAEEIRSRAQEQYRGNPWWYH